MPVYGFRCSACGDFEVARPMAADVSAERCPRCPRSARRVFSAPMLRRVAPAVSQAVDRSAATADVPEVVGSVPVAPRRARRITTDPRHAALPRP